MRLQRIEAWAKKSDLSKSVGDGIIGFYDVCIFPKEQPQNVHGHFQNKAAVSRDPAHSCQVESTGLHESGGIDG